MIYLAHKTDDKEQTLQSHSMQTAANSRDFAVAPLKDICYTIGLLHDVGKYLQDFQKRIRGQNIRVEHSVCGAQYCQILFKNAMLRLLTALCIAGHHTGIPDCGTRADTPDMPTLQGRLKRKTADFSQFKQEIEVPFLDETQFMDFFEKDCTTKEDIVEKFAFFVRYCFSCLTDADSLDTSNKMNSTLSSDFMKCLNHIEDQIKSFTCKTELQKARSRLQQQAFDKAGSDSEIYLMNMPTGSGKTLCSMKFALMRAIKTGKKRIIYIIPYNSIIEQTAETFEQLFTSDARLLRHQSTFSYENQPDLDEDSAAAAKSACENWDAQLIITTAVQFFESIYANKRGKLRKMHNMADSILVFDEAHLMPTHCLQPCLRSIAYITRYLNSEAVFLTATMPDFKTLLRQYALPDTKVTDLIDDISDFEKFEKCKYSYIGVFSDEALLSKASESPASLIVVNSRKAACKLYQLCAEKNKYHLSTYMTAFDRSAVLAEIRQQLKALSEEFPNFENVPPDRRIIVISTSLIEAGVDLDFHTVFRELSGLDSILQAGGRCNREGKRISADVFVFEREENQGRMSGDERYILTKGILNEFPNIVSKDAIKAYYERLFFARREEITKYAISADCKNFRLIRFASYEMKFIESQTISVAVERDEISRKLILDIQNRGIGRLRDIQKYCFSVYVYEFNLLLQQGVVDDYGSGIYCLKSSDYYNDKTGVLFEGRDLFL